MHLGARAQGGSGLIMTESAAVAPEGLTTPQDTDMWNDEQQAVWTGSSSSATARVPRWRSTAGPRQTRCPMYRGFRGEPEGYVQPADEGWTTVGTVGCRLPRCALCHMR